MICDYESDPNCVICADLDRYKICWACSSAKELEAEALKDIKKMEEKFEQDLNKLISMLIKSKIKDIHALIIALKTKDISYIPAHLLPYFKIFSKYEYEKILKNIYNNDKISDIINNKIAQASIFLLESSRDIDYNYMLYCLKKRKNYNLVTEFILTNLSDNEINNLLDDYTTDFDVRLKEYKTHFTKLLKVVKFKPLKDLKLLDENVYVNNILNNVLYLVAPKYAWEEIIADIDYNEYINVESLVDNLTDAIITIITDPKYEYVTEGRLDGEGIFRSKEELNLHEQWLCVGCTLTALIKQKTVNLFKKGKEDREYTASVLHTDIQCYLYNNCPLDMWETVIKNVCRKYDKIKHAGTVKIILESTLPLESIKSIKDLRKNKEKNRNTYIAKMGKNPNI